MLSFVLSIVFFIFNFVMFVLVLCLVIFWLKAFHSRDYRAWMSASYSPSWICHSVRYFNQYERSAFPCYDNDAICKSTAHVLSPSLIFIYSYPSSCSSFPSSLAVCFLLSFLILSLLLIFISFFSLFHLCLLSRNLYHFFISSSLFISFYLLFISFFFLSSLYPLSVTSWYLPPFSFFCRNQMDVKKLLADLSPFL